MNRSHEHARLMLEKAAEDALVLERLAGDEGAQVTELQAGAARPPHREDDPWSSTTRIAY